MAPVGFEIDPAFVSRLLLGALSEHEQRMLAIRLLRCDPEVRRDVRAVLQPFEVFDLEFIAEYARALAADRGREESDLASIRGDVLGRAARESDELTALMKAFTLSDLLSLGEVTHKFFSWSMAELLLERGRREKNDRSRARTSLYLALMVIDVVELLAACGQFPEYPSVAADVRRRIRAAHADLGS